MTDKKSFLHKFTTELMAGYTQIEKTLSSAKFAVFIISLFAIALTYGTFMESYHGREYANRLVYKATWFILIQFSMLLSIVFAVVVRLPLKKRLYGFYTVHLGLVVLFVGSFITYQVGVDGMLELYPNTPNNVVSLDDDYIEITHTESGKVYNYPLPFKAGVTNLDHQFPDIGLKLLDYYPSSDYQIQWLKEPGKKTYAATYQLWNMNLAEEITLSLNPQGDFNSLQRLGPLSVHQMPQVLKNCFKSEEDSSLLVWNTITGECQNSEKIGMEIGKTPKGSRFALLEFGDKVYRFFPEVSPFPLNDDLSKDESAPFRVLSKKIFEEKPHLFLFEDALAFHTKRKGWQLKELKGDVKLPWMGFHIKKVTGSSDFEPRKIPEYSLPLFDNDKVIQGGMSSVKIAIKGNEFWVTSQNPLALSTRRSMNNEDPEKSALLKIQLKKTSLALPYQITLERFKMDTNPGTRDPASYESFVALLDGRNQEGASKHHVFMNNPLKYDDFTFYQSSYFPLDDGSYGSAFSVNFDPGRWVKYLGSFLIVFGSWWHFWLQNRKRKPQSVQKD